MKSAPAKETQLLFDMFGEELVAPFVTTSVPIAETKGPEPVASIEIPRPAVPRWPRNSSDDPVARRYATGESDRSFVFIVGERSGQGWRSRLALQIRDSFAMSEQFDVSPVHKTLGDALGTVRHHAMERLRTEAAKIHGSFPPPHEAESDDATALYWALGREDFRDLLDPDEAVAPPVAESSPITEPAPEFAPIDEEILDWRVPGALARVRIFHPRADSGETWTWNVEWSTGSSSEVEAILPAESRADCIERGRTQLLETFSGIAIAGKAYTSRKAEHDRSCALYRLVRANRLPIDASGEETTQEAA